MKRGKRGGVVRDRALREFYDRSSRLEEGKNVRAVAMTFGKPRRLVALRLEEETVRAIRHLAEEKGLNYSTLMRMWITERLRQERAASQ
jgi:predicted DNA binding CopG/RHH family protein